MDEGDEQRGALTAELDALGVWTLQEPTADFADAVVGAASSTADPAAPSAVPDGVSSAVASAGPSPGRSRLRWLLALTAAVVVAVAVWRWPRVGVERGMLDAAEQRTVSVADRAVLVAESGAALQWRVDSGGVTVEQTRGAVFYRVDPGGPFVVQTPSGQARVTGTCFSVEIGRAEALAAVPSVRGRDSAGEAITMKPYVRSAALGAAVAAAVTVTVYEGGVVFANDGGEVLLGPGARARAVGAAPPTQLSDGGADAPPDVSPPDVSLSADVSALRAQARGQAETIERLQAQLERATGHESDPVDVLAPKRFGYNGPPMPEGFDYYAPTQEALLEMAECGVVAWDQPPVWADDEQPDPQYVRALGLSDQDAAAFVEIFDQFRSESTQTARQFWQELGGDPAAAASIEPSELLGLVYGRSDYDERERGRIQMAMERAGLAQRPEGEMSTTERLMRWDASLGEAFERALAERFGDSRAHELRESRGGWSGKRSTWADVCADR